MRVWAAGIVASALAAPCQPARAAGPEIPVVVPGTATVLGRLSRRDDGFPFASESFADRTACMLDPRAVPLPRLKALVREGSRDRVGAYRTMLGITEGCMAAKGWRFVPCGGDGEPSCPAAAEADPHPDGDGADP